MDQTLPWDQADPAAQDGSAPATEGKLGVISPPAPPPPEGCPAPVTSQPRRRTARRATGLTPEQRVLRARIAAYHLHATRDPKETTKKAREAFAARFEREVDPDGVLSAEERARRAEAARRAYFTRLALRSSRSRRRVG